ncbi:MAG: FeoB-associated Cys-rich membrane protein [Armatimonadetes bacterium]|nr:FeoB-associated Cys-rich membrane protein [Armatimonadota bacterium]
MTQDMMIVTIVVTVCAVFVLRRFWKSAKGEKGSCRSCGDTCSCEIKEAIQGKK